MRLFNLAKLLPLAAILVLPSPHAHGQSADPTASQQLALSAFGGGTGTYTNIYGGRNASVTAGADLAFMTFRRYRPVLEVRGSFPLHSGTIDGQKNFLGGLKVERQFGPLHPYADFLIGRGKISYQRGGLPVGTILFLSSTSTVYSPGVGLDYDVSPHWAAKVDFQYQHWDVPFAVADGAPAPPTFVGTPGGVVQVATTGTIYPKALTFGVVYRFDFNHHYRRPRRDRDQ